MAWIVRLDGTSFSLRAKNGQTQLQTDRLVVKKPGLKANRWSSLCICLHSTLLNRPPGGKSEPPTHAFLRATVASCCEKGSGEVITSAAVRHFSFPLSQNRLCTIQLLHVGISGLGFDGVERDVH